MRFPCPHTVQDCSSPAHCDGLPLWNLTSEQEQVQDNPTTEASNPRAQKARRVDPLLDHRAVTFDEMVSGLADQDLDTQQLKEHWASLNELTTECRDLNVEMHASAGWYHHVRLPSSTVPTAFDYLEAGNVTAAEGAVFQAYNEAGYKMESECTDPRRPFDIHSATLSHNQVDRASGSSAQEAATAEGHLGEDHDADFAASVALAEGHTGDGVPLFSDDGSLRSLYQTGQLKGLSQQHIATQQKHSRKFTPLQFSLDGFIWKFPPSIRHHRPRDLSCASTSAWHRYSWQMTCIEVYHRFGVDGQVHLESSGQSYALVDLYIYLFHGFSGSGIQPTVSDQWKRDVDELHSVVHHKLLDRDLCPVCVCRKRHNQGLSRAEWDFNGVTILWEATLSTIHKHGTGWSSWHHSFTSHSVGSLPPKLQMEDIPIEKVEELPGGVYKWGKYVTAADTESLEAGHACLNERWHEDRRRRINLLREIEQQPPAVQTKHPGDKMISKLHGQLISYEGRVWRSSEQWVFQENGTGIQVTVILNPDDGILKRYDSAERKLYKAIKAEHVKLKMARVKSNRREAGKADIPQSAADMTVKRKTPEGKLVYAWGDSDKGRIEVPVTPRALRLADPSKSHCAIDRESTPERALRKMILKVKRVQSKASLGQQERIVVKASMDSTTHSQPTAPIPEEVFAPSLKTLNDPTSLQHVIAAFVFLSSIRLHHCYNCDEEWPVFDNSWPQTGVKWVGHKAGKCETISAAGFRASTKDATLCSRCDSATACQKMYCEENLQHLGPRHPGLSALTWYESLLIARIHPVMSVITLTATGLMCYAGHVCNYYVKVMDWVRGLPAVLRHKKWFLIKRRRSIRAGDNDTRQKKPTTANRYRLEAAIKEAMQFMPTVYATSIPLPEELDKFPTEGEQEMFEQEESVDLSGEVHITQDFYTIWFDSGKRCASKHPCAAVLFHYALDQQGTDFRGSVAADTAWELCCRLLNISPAATKIGTRDLAQLLVYWMEDNHVPVDLAQAVYVGMEEELKSRNKRIETDGDDQLMRCRWVRQSIHEELDSLREELASTGEDMPMELEVVYSTMAFN